MKRLILTGLATLAFVTAVLGRTDPSWINNSVLLCPPSLTPVIDARAFVNNSAFILNTFNSLLTQPYATANTVYYTNYGVLGSLEGFRFDTFNTSTARYTNAGTLLNEVGAIINCGGTNDGPYFATNNAGFFTAGFGSVCLVRATNIINRGTIEMGEDSLLSLQGQNVNLTGGLLNMEGFETGPFYGQVGMFAGYWGLGQTPGFNPASSFGTINATSPEHWVTNRYYSDFQTLLSLGPVNAYMNPGFVLGPSNFLWQVVYVQNSEPSFPTTNINVYFPGLSVVEWTWISTNIVTGIVSTNRLFLEDQMLAMTNLSLTTNGVAPPNTGYGPTYIPTNYFLFQFGGPSFGFPATPGLLPGIFTPNRNINAEYTAYEAIFRPTTVLVGETAGQNFTNMPGRIEVTASKQLDLRSSRISGLNYLRLTATNHFMRDGGTRILTAVADYNLGVTNSTLVVSNLLAPTCPRLDGFVDLFSTRWTNINSTTDITNTYFVLMVDSHLASSSPSLVQNLTLHADNVVISDVLNVLSNITIDAYNLWITTNGPTAQTPAGELNYPSGRVLGIDSLPRLRTLTNYGLISVQNAAAFGSASDPYWDFVNHGRILTAGCSIWSTNFENTGLIDAGPGHATVSATSAVLSNGTINALFNDIILSAGSLLISNHVLNAGHNLTIWATNSLTDGGPGNGSVWASGVLGFNLPFLAPIANLLGTTVTSTAPAWAAVVNQWAGQDRGAVPSGFTNNAALGKLFLNGGLNSSFIFTGPNAANALYVDYLEFQNYMTNFDDSGNLLNLQFAPGMKIYYAQLVINGVSFAEKLNHKNGGGLNWVSSYAGAFSSTNLVYPDGTTNRLNQALVESCDLDSNFNGVPNCMDPAPVLVPSQLGLAATFTNVPPRAVALSWNTIPFSANYVYFKPSVTATNWQLLTSFVFNSPVAGRTRIVDPLGAGARYYRVRVDALSP
jgi:hypothetical protein